MPLIQMHRQFLKEGGRTEFVAQKNISSDEELREWSKDINERFPLPDGVVWLWCNEESRFFAKTT